MKDISKKKITRRTAIASADIQLSVKAFDALIKKGSPKGDVFETAKIASIMAAKGVPLIIPMCHPLNLSKVDVVFSIDKKEQTVRVICEVSCLGRTGVEMEALTAASVGALTIYDMMKWCDKGGIIKCVKLLEKKGGKSGHYRRT